MVPKNSLKKINSITDLTPDKKNSREHNARNVSMIMDSIGEVGVSRSGVIDEEGNILAGNGTYQALGELGLKKIKVVKAAGDEWVVVQRDDLSEEDKVKVSLYDNRTAELATWDPAILQEMNEDDPEFMSRLFSAEELDSVFDLIAKDTGPMDGEDNVPEVPKKAKTKLGQVYRLGEHFLMCGDSTDKGQVDRLMDGQRADIGFTSPPYNADANSHLTGQVKGFDKKYNSGHSDDLTDNKYLDLIIKSTELLIENCKYSFVNLQMLTHNRLPLFQFQNRFHHLIKDVLIWVKNTCPPNIVKGAFNTKWEYVFCFSNDNKTRGFPCEWQGKYPNVIETESAGQNQYAETHKATFPVVFPEWIISKMDFAHSVFDPFGGSGSTLIACEKLNRKCYMMEIDPLYCDVIIDRYKKLFPENEVRELKNGSE